MRLTDPVPGIIIQVDAISPEVVRAQRMAELRNIAEFRARHLKAIQDWSDPVKREKIKAENAVAERAARDSMAGLYIDDYRVRRVKNEIFVQGLQDVTIKPMAKPINQVSRLWTPSSFLKNVLARLRNWFR